MSLEKPIAPESSLKLASTSAERAQYDNLADLFSIFVATEMLEKAYVRDAISSNEYVSRRHGHTRPIPASRSSPCLIEVCV